LPNVDGKSDADIKGVLLLEPITIALDLENGLVKTGYGADLYLTRSRVLFQVGRENIDGRLFRYFQTGAENRLEIGCRVKGGFCSFHPGFYFFHV
jgi:hypothetical protein